MTGFLCTKVMPFSIMQKLYSFLPAFSTDFFASSTDFFASSLTFFTNSPRQHSSGLNKLLIFQNFKLTNRLFHRLRWYHPHPQLKSIQVFRCKLCSSHIP